MKTIRRILKMVAGILLIPFVWGAAGALWNSLTHAGSLDSIFVRFAAGASAWILIQFFLPNPARTYVFGHEMTHMLFSVLSGGKMERMRIGKDGGHVVITKSNFLVSLSPYFFPFYTVITAVIFFLGDFFLDWSAYYSLLYFLLGFTYAFHILQTFAILKIEQSDIAGETYVFSASVILLGNLLIVLLGLSLFRGEWTPLKDWLDRSFSLWESII